MTEWKETKLGQIPADWDSKTVDEVKSIERKSIISGPFGSNISSKFFMMDGVPVIRGNNLSLDVGKRFIDDGFVFITQDKANELGTWATKDDLIFTAAGTIGQVGILTGSERYSRYIISNKQLRVRLDKTIVEPLFAYYWFASPFMTNTINGRDTGSTIPLINLSVLKGLPIPLPPLPEQQAIAEILSSLDDKIDLLHRQNKTLEALAETLFRQWFVEEAEESWERKPLDQIANYLNGLALQKYPVKGGESLPVIKIRELNQGVTDSTDKCSRAIPEQYVIQDGDILFSWSGSLQIVIWHDGEGALNQHLFKVTSENYPKWFYYLATKHHLEDFRAIAESKSTTMGHIQRHHLTEAFISIPPEELFTQYDNSISPLIEKLIKNNAQIKSLTEQRDTLLPKLMSGEVRVNIDEAETASATQ